MRALTDDLANGKIPENRVDKGQKDELRGDLNDSKGQGHQMKKKDVYGKIPVTIERGFDRVEAYKKARKAI